MTPAERAKRYRDQAAEIRAAAEQAKTPESRQMLLEIAESYEALASRIDSPLPPSKSSDKSIPCE